MYEEFALGEKDNMLHVTVTKKYEQLFQCEKNKSKSVQNETCYPNSNNLSYSVK